MEGTISQLGLKNYLINNKKKKESFFKHNYKNFGNFAKTTLNFNFNNNLNFGTNASFRIDKDARYGDFISNMVLKLKLPALTGNTGGQTHHYTDGVGNAIVEKITLKIGGQIVDDQTSEWLDIWSSLNINEGNSSNYNNMIRKTNIYNEYRNEGIIYVPLQFWFCQYINNYENTPLVFPLVSFQNTPIEIIIKLRNLNELITYDGCTDKTTITESKSILESELLVDFIVLENEERLKYLEAKNQIYLINQVQHLTQTFNASQTVVNVSLKPFKYPITELLWVFRSKANKDRNHYFNFSNGVLHDSSNLSFFSKMKLNFDGRERINNLDSEFFSELEPGKHHKNVIPFSRINTYSFSLDPVNFAQPSGSCNFSGLHEPKMEFTMNTGVPAGEIIVFAINYNVLQINSAGNACLLHNLSKNTPDKLPDIYRGKMLEECNLTVLDTQKAKQLIAYINELNIFKDPRKIETGLANIIQNADLQKIVQDKMLSKGGLTNVNEITNPILDSLILGLTKLGKVIKDVRNGNVISEDSGESDKKYLKVAGMVMDLDDSVTFFNKVLEEYLELDKESDVHPAD